MAESAMQPALRTMTSGSASAWSISGQICGRSGWRKSEHPSTIWPNAATDALRIRGSAEAE